MSAWPNMRCRMRTILRTALAALLAAACTDATATTGPTPSAGGSTGGSAVASVTVSGAGGALAVGESAQLSASAAGADGAALQGVTFTWSSDRPSVARVDASTGVVTAVAAGVARVTATAAGKSGSADVTVLAGAAPVTGIAYIWREQIRIINPDGTGDRLLWSSPAGPPGSQFVWPVRGLTWRPDGTELAFASDHEAAYSWFGFDIYALRADGQGLRRLTNPPARADFASYPKGTVRVTVTATLYSTVAFQVYVMGAPAPKYVYPAAGMTQVITFDNVADLGSGVQPVVAILGEKRWIAEEAPDVQAGKTVDVKLIIDANRYSSGFGAGAPLWRADGGNVAFVLTPKCTLRYVSDPPGSGPSLNPLLDASAVAGFCVYDRGPTAATAGKLLLASGLGDDRTSYVYLANEGSNTLPAPLLSFDNQNDIHDIRWLPDGSGFILAMRDGLMDEDVNLYEYDFPAGPLRKVTDFNVPWQYLRSFSISPDGRQIVYEWTTDPIYGLSGPSDLYVMNRDGSNPHLLVKDASYPAWSPARR